jgi:hypothetical protein
LLEDPEFRAYWDIIRTHLRQQRLARASLVEVGIAVALISVLSVGAIPAIRQLLPPPVEFLAVMFVAGVLGTTVASLVNLYVPSYSAPRAVSSTLGSFLRHLSGGAAGICGALVLGSFIEITALPKLGSAASLRTFLVAWLAGYASRSAIPDLMTRIFVVEKRS